MDILQLKSDLKSLYRAFMYSKTKIETSTSNFGTIYSNIEDFNNIIADLDVTVNNIGI